MAVSKSFPPTWSVVGATTRVAPRVAPTSNLPQLEPKYIKHSGVALFLEFRRVRQGALAQRARSRGDGHILLAVDLEAHGRRCEAGADIDLPQLLERGVVESRDRAVEQGEEYEAAAGRKRARTGRIAQVGGLLDLLGHRIDGGEVGFEALARCPLAAVPAALGAVLDAVDRDGHADRHRRNVDELGARIV